MKRSNVGLAYTDVVGTIYYDERRAPLADGGIVRPPRPEELIEAPPGTVQALLPGRTPLIAGRSGTRRGAPGEVPLAAILPSGYTRLLVPAYETLPGAPTLPLFGYTFACVVDDKLFVAATRTDEGEDWSPRYFAQDELTGKIATRRATDPESRVLAQLEICSREYGCFTAQNVFLERGEAALPVSPKCNARCVGCISELAPDAGIPSPQTRIAYETTGEELARIALHHLDRVPDGIVSFGQGCEGEPLLRIDAIERAIRQIRAIRPRGSEKSGTINMNTNGSLPRSLERAIAAGLEAVRISLNSVRPAVYAAYYRPLGYDLSDVLQSIRLASAAGLRVSLNYLTHPGITDEREEVEALAALLASTRIDMIQTRTLNIDPEVYFAAAGRPREPIGMRAALDRVARHGVRLGNFTHVH